MNVLERSVRDVLARADIEIGGERPHDVRIHDPAVYSAFVQNGIVGARDAYVAGQWDTERLDELTFRFLTSGVAVRDASPLTLALRDLVGTLFNVQIGERGRAVRRHYDLGNDLFEAMLDRRMIYSCAYWADADDLDAAQEAKLDLLCRKLRLESGMRLLDIGCGWGGLARFAAERYGVRVVGITISGEQGAWARDTCRGLPVEIRVQDYRALEGERFDAIVSVGMFEHVGYKNYRRYLDIVRRVLRRDGLFVLHTIGGPKTRRSYDPWFDRHIFPNSQLPSASQIASAAEGRFVIEDWHNIGADYDRTLMAWFANFERNWPQLRDRYGETFYRTWKCFLLTSAGSFRARELQTWQVVLSPHGVAGGYRR